MKTIFFLLFTHAWAMPTADNLFQTFSGVGVGKSTWPAECLNKDYANHPIKFKIENGKMVEKIIGDYRFVQLDPLCMPSITFSWASDGFLRKIKKNYGGRSKYWGTILKDEEGNVNQFFTSFSPIATYNFGDNLIRVKHKKWVKYWFNLSKADTLQACKILPKEMRENGVIVRTNEWGDGNLTGEYNFCTFSPMESWSVNTKVIYDEMVREYLNFEQHKDNLTGFIYYKHEKKTGMPLVFRTYNLQKNDLAKRFNTILEKIMVKGDGPIFHNPSLRGKKGDHFPSRKPIYWNQENP